ncbi:MAG: hypothetical protein U0412_05920 [Nitrospira sp.]
MVADQNWASSAFRRRVPAQGGFPAAGFGDSDLGRGLEEPEYHVEKDPRTMPVHENPVRWNSCCRTVRRADLSIKFHGNITP